MKVFLFLPTHENGQYLGTTVRGRATDYDDLRQIAQASDSLGYGGRLVPTGRSNFYKESRGMLEISPNLWDGSFGEIVALKHLPKYKEALV
ncbi:hypothetical protein DNHGIG_04910 [Collibacillus ludicampi]|uniref:Uncharacterized protein n=1 Tax=Collibacillus ludicampi TaxID=2771369 RepID=A0AAV4LAX0_9BACL|nr:hypothetical protein [Collibacillus ludicampi]GIM44942.1 hypothetical protein DNHGIG_04910 [Collibacillus ludicampi]